MSENELNQDYDFQSNVLIVDDVAENIQVLGNILDENDIEFSYATSGKEALEAIAYSKPDLLLLDINMPEMSGFEVCEELKKDPETKRIPIIFLTARTEQEDIVKGLTIGAVDYVIKPFNPKELISRVITHLELSNSRKIIQAQNERLTDINKDLKESIATKNKFFNIIAHDLKNPLGTIIGFSDLLTKNFDELTPDKQREYTQYIKQASAEAFELLVNLLEWARLQTGRIQSKPVELSTDNLINMTIHLLKPSAEKKAITLESNHSEPYKVWGDQNMILTVLRNLGINAIKFTGVNGKVILNSEYSPEDSMVRITVEDNGIGIKPEHIQELFRIDSKHSTDGTAGEKGTGLGLILCKEFVEMNGGSIWAESEPGKRTKFHFTIPAVV